MLAWLQTACTTRNVKAFNQTHHSFHRAYVLCVHTCTEEGLLVLLPSQSRLGKDPATCKVHSLLDNVFAGRLGVKDSAEDVETRG